jgi:hypothetical protein
VTIPAAQKRTVSDRARVQPATHAPRQADAGVARCIDLMSKGQWVAGKSHQDVADEFGCSLRTVEHWAVTASRAIRIVVGEGEELRIRLAARLESIGESAMQKQAAKMDGTLYSSPDHKAAVSALTAEAELMGLLVKRHEHAHVVAHYEQLPRAEKAAWLRERAQRMLAEADRLDGVVEAKLEA